MKRDIIVIGNGEKKKRQKGEKEERRDINREIWRRRKGNETRREKEEK